MADISRLPAPTHDQWDWQLAAACRGLDSAVFFHPEYERGANRASRVAAAKVICRRCPVVQQCRDYALTVQEPYGTWGGLDEQERNALIRARRRPTPGRAA